MMLEECGVDPRETTVEGIDLHSESLYLLFLALDLPGEIRYLFLKTVQTFSLVQCLLYRGDHQDEEEEQSYHCQHTR